MPPLLPGPVTMPGAQSENWSDDPSFDFESTPVSLGSSSSSSSSPFHSSPLRASSSKSHQIVEEDDDEDWDLPMEPEPLKLKAQHQPQIRSRDFSSASTPTHSQQRISHRPRTSTSSLVEAGQVMATGPKGVGVIKKLGSSSFSTPSTTFFQRAAKQQAVEKDWESDLDFGDVEFKPSNRLALSPPTQKGNVGDLDDLEGFLNDEDDRGQDTLRAGDTIKGLLPPPRPKGQVNTIKSLAKGTQPPATDEDDFELESAFSLPLTLSHLTLASGSSSPNSSSRDQRSQPRASQSTSSQWDSSVTSGNKSSAFDASPSSGRSGRSETSATSFFSAGFTTDLDLGQDVKILGAQAEEDDDMDDDMEDGLVLPTPSFFSSGRVNELNSLLDRKRKQTAAPAVQPLQHRREESFEDGLVLSGHGGELTQHRLIKGRKARTLPLPAGSTASMRRSMMSQGRATTGRDRERERERERDREMGWNRPKSPGPNALLSQRSQSATNNSTSIPAQSPYRRPESPLVQGHHRLPTSSSVSAEQSNDYGSVSRSRGLVNIPPPTPSASASAGATGSMRLRHQMSHQRLMQPPPSPSIARKQSLASLQDALATQPAPVVDIDSRLGSMRRKSNLGLMQPPSTTTPQSSRLTMPTASSRAKTRTAVNQIFPKHEPRPVVARVMNAPKRVRAYGDGTELEGIEDLSVDREREVSRDKQADGAMRVGLGRPSRRAPYDVGITSKRDEPSASEKRKKTPTGSTKRVLDANKTKSGRPRKPALLIKNLGGSDKKKVVGDMTWNPQTLRWEGNENVLRDFDNHLTSSTRPALIAHFTGSSVGMPSPTVGATQTVRIVGDMRFDPERMCWVSNLAPEDDEPDPFEGMADDEDEENGGSTITRAAGRKVASTVAYSGAWSSRLASESSASTSMGSTFDGEDEKLWEECKAAEERHRVEMRGWTVKSLGGAVEARERERREEKRLWEIRNLALRS